MPEEVLQAEGDRLVAERLAARRDERRRVERRTLTTPSEGIERRGPDERRQTSTAPYFVGPLQPGHLYLVRVDAHGHIRTASMTYGPSEHALSDREATTRLLQPALRAVRNQTPSGDATELTRSRNT